MIAEENSRNLSDISIFQNRNRSSRVRGALRKIRTMRGRKTEKRVSANSNLQKKSFSLRNNLHHGNKKGVSLGRLGSLEARIASNKRQIKRAQALRYFVFYEEMSAIADEKSARKKRDIDPYDIYCDHVLVVDHGTKEKRIGRTRPKLVGTYRLLRQEIAESKNGFYTQGEFDVKSLIENHSDAYFLELGRSCVLKEYRGKHTIELLWSAIWRYVLEYKIDVMFGCASFPTTHVDEIAHELSFLHHYIETPKDWYVKAHDNVYTNMNILEKDEVNPKRALAKLPPLIKGYLRLGAYIGDGAFVDHQFGTTDVCMILPVKNISEKYIKYFGAGGERHSGS